MKKIYKKPETEIIAQTGDVLTTSNELKPTGITFGIASDGENGTLN